MTAKETARLIDWLKAKGMSDADAVECIKFIATGIQPDNKDSKDDNNDK